MLHELDLVEGTGYNLGTVVTCTADCTAGHEAELNIVKLRIKKNNKKYQ